MDLPSILHQCFKYVSDDAVVRTVFAEMQLFKRVENYFTDSLLYQESNKSVKKLLPNDIDSGNEADSKLKEDAPTTFIMESIVAYLDDPDCNNPAENEGERVINENVAFDYSLCLEDIFKSVDISFLHMPLPISKMACIHIGDNERFVFIIPPSKRDQSPIVSSRGQTQTTTSRESEDDLKTPQFFYYARGQHIV